MSDLFSAITQSSLHCGDSREVLKNYPDDYFSAVITDPPYALVSIVKRFGGENAAPAKSNGATGVYARASAGFMGKQWDTGEVAFNEEFWREVYRVLKPGGHIVSFGGTRTYHRMACAIEDAGFEIRDQIQWLYGTGFPKSHDVSKAIDKAAGAERAIVGFDPVAAKRSAAIGTNSYGDYSGQSGDITKPATPDAEQWEGWGTALKPANEPICLARKPLSEKTVALNVLKWGTGALNIDGCRIEAEKFTGWGGKAAGGNTWNKSNSGLVKDGDARPVDGRFPANVIHDGSDEVIAAFPTAPGQQGDLKGHSKNRPTKNTFGDMGPAKDHVKRNDSGSAARFFYSAKASKADRGEGNNHPTVKPTDLMAYLCRLVTPPGGVVLDPFMGSGSTGKAAKREGFRFVGIEREQEYFEIASERIS